MIERRSPAAMTLIAFAHWFVQAVKRVHALNAISYRRTKGTLRGQTPRGFQLP
jgi:hypothetical protein